MATRSRVKRLLQLASLIESGIGLNAGQIALSYRVSVRTIRRDIRELRSAGYAVEVNESRGGYQLIG